MTDQIPNAERGRASGTGLEQFAPAILAPQAPSQSGGGLASAFDPSEILRILNKWKWLILAALVLGPLIALGASLAVSKQYKAIAQIQINQEDPVVVPGAANAKPLMINGQEFLATQIGLLKSRALTLRVVDALRVANNPEYVSQGRSAAERRDQAAEGVRAQLLIEPLRDSRLVNISISGDDPAMAARLADAYAEQFIASNLDREFEATSYARKFLEEQIDSTRVRLEDSERLLVDYAKRQGIIELGTGGQEGGQQSLEAATLVELNKSLSDARNQRILAEQRFRRSGSTASGIDAVNNPVLQELTRQRSAAQAEYQEKLVVFLPGLPAMQALKERIASLDRDISRTRGTVSTASRGEYEGAVARERELQSRLDGMKGQVLDLRSRSIQYNILQREVDTSRALYDALLQKYKEVGVGTGVGVNKVAIVDRARVPKTPISPNIPLNVLLGLLAGLALGIGAAFMIEFIDDTIKSPDDVRGKLNLTLLGAMPQGEGKFMEETADPKSELIEAAHSLRTALQFATGHGMPRTLLITSSRPGEGKSSVSLALATSLALLGKKVLIIDADMRKPTFYIGDASRKDTPGLSNALSGELRLAAVTRATEIANLSVVPAGPVVPNPAALLSDGGFAVLLDEAKEQHEFVVIDGPPVMGLADAPLMGSVADAALLVVEASQVHRSTVLTAVARLHGANTRLLGAVLNKFESRKNGYGYAYSYNYGVDGNDSQSNDERKIVLVR